VRGATWAEKSGAAALWSAAACRPEETAIIAPSLKRQRHLARRFLTAARIQVTRWTRPAPLLENALLRHQVVVLNRSVTRPRLTAADRGLVVLLACRLRAWAGALVVAAKTNYFGAWGLGLAITNLRDASSPCLNDESGLMLVGSYAS